MVLAFAGCAAPDELTRESAEDLVRSSFFDREPVYAEVPSVVRWSPESPRDEFDRLSLATLGELARAGLVTINEEIGDDRGEVSATLTSEGARVLGMVPSSRGPAFRGRIAEKKLDGTGDVRLHPSDPRTGRVEVLWHYENPTSLYPLFHTRRDKPLNQTFAAVLVVQWIEGAWRGSVIVRKTRPTSPGGSVSGLPGDSQ